ncbi:hypothetical protein EAH_00009160 [Eimeria acervulina]|uniref:Dynein heavy chain tail domain-containing protein n=1 Tax=Eimeria acervulina TaxID=5801 RepID=U6GFJ8_EIMAC|nr:hypothetical protein EAH_00009160 [Eimeria acervulina]CDI78970.1 hypothetical protein EAH_00009160 [Eimeria acervulina]
MGVLNLQDSTAWNNLITRDSQKADKQLEQFLEAGTAGTALFFAFTKSEGSQGVEEMNRCMLVGLVGPCILEDLTHILEGFLVPLLSYEPQPIISADVEQAAAAPAIAGKPASPECMKLKGKLGSSSSTDSHPPDTESLLDGEDDDYEESAASSSPSRLASTSAAERKTSASIVGTAGPTEEYVAADEAPDESTPDASVPFLDPECKNRTMHLAADWSVPIGEMVLWLAGLPKLILELLEAESQREHDCFLPVSEVNFWRDRYTAVSLLYEQLLAPQCQQAIQQFEEAQPDSTVSQSFKKALNELQQLHTESMSNVRFLATLERYFTTLGTSPLGPMADTIASLMNALRMVWVTSRHYTTDERMQNLMERIAYQLEIRIRQDVCVEQLLRNDVEEASTILQQSRVLLETWKAEYFNMRSRLEESECNRRWEFDRRKLFRTTDYMASMCSKFEEIVKTIGQFRRFIGPKLHSVTRSRRAVNRLTEKMQVLIGSFDSVSDRVFCEKDSEEVFLTVKQFWRRTEELEDECITFLDTKFTRLRSALGAFEMLKDFTTTASRPRINVKLGEKFVDILKHFNTEVDRMRDLFDEGRENPCLPSHMPPVSGAILWSSGLLQSLKASVLAFKQMPEVFDFEQAEDVFGNYLSFAKSITAYQNSLVKQWQVAAVSTATECLKSYVLRRQPNGAYAVNFRPDVWVVMQEARYLDQLGMREAPAAVVNVALHKVSIMATTWASCMFCRAVLPGLTTLNWTSLGLEDFVGSSLKALTIFKATCEQVFKNVEIIEQIVKEIEEAQLDFYDYIEEHRARVVEGLQVRYESVTSYLKKIEELLEGRMTGSSETMAAYYNYWERRIFNAIATMLIRAVLLLQHITKYVKNWSKYEAEWSLWNPDRKSQLEQLMIKRPNLVYFDVYVRAYDKLAAELGSIPKVKTVAFIQLDSSTVIDGIRRQALVISRAYADTLHEIAKRERLDLKKLINERREKLEVETDTLERFKVLMESVTTINDSAMDAEIRLAEMREMYSTLQSYDYPINQAEMTDLTALPREWKELRNLAHRKTRQLASIKTKFAGEKKQEVADFMVACKALQQKFRDLSSSVDTPLAEGRQAMTALEEEIVEFKARAAELNNAENLFSLPVTAFTILDKLEGEVKQQGQIFTLFADHDVMVKEWASQLWAKVDFQVGATECTSEYEVVTNLIRTSCQGRS